MTQQAPESAQALWTRLQANFDDTPRTAHVETAAGQANWPAGFGQDIPDVRSIVVHLTAGWPSHSKWDEFVSRYTDPAATKRGIGPHFYLAYDGTVFRLLTETRQCWHASYVNGWAIGVETGNLADGVGGVVAPAAGAGGAWPNHWRALSANAEDVPGGKFYARSVNNEILVALWSTNNVAQADSHADANLMMKFSEAQYRSWAKLGRWLCEVWRVPRNFPLRPHLRRENTWQAAQWLNYRRTVDADPMRDPHLRTQLQQAPYNCNSATFESNVPATGLPHVYALGVQNLPKHRNELWTWLFNSYRGFHGHGYSGAIVGDDHNCPGAWFDWHRFARDVWDYWWYPFDLTQASPADPVTSGVAPRDYGQTDGVLYEHFFDEDASKYARVTTSGFYPVGDESIAPHFLPRPPGKTFGPIGELVRMFSKYWGFFHGGMHFQLASGSPIYAMAAGQVVAARLHTADAVPDAFNRNDPASPHPSRLMVLLRHEVFFQRGAGDRINYDLEPARVYSLYMHLGVPTGLTFTDVDAANPVWLNRAIAMRKEYDLGLPFAAAHPNPAAQWAPHLTRWNRRRNVIDAALTNLQAGRAAVFPEGEDAIHLALGDLVGVAGHLDHDTFGVHVEIFSRNQVNDPWFEAVDQSGSASKPYHDEANLDETTNFLKSRAPAGTKDPFKVDAYRDLPPEQKATKFPKVALRSKSEWALAKSDFPAGGWAPAEALMWWNDVVPTMNAATPAVAQLPADGVIWHYHPLGFLSWLNGITWKSEWSKYRVTDAAGAAVPVPVRPPARR